MKTGSVFVNSPQLARSILYLALVAMASGAWAAEHKTLTTAYGVANSGLISLPGQIDRFTFAGARSDRLLYVPLDPDGEAIKVRVNSPEGVQLWETEHSYYNGPFHLPQTGSYTLVLDGVYDTTGDYAFKLLDLATATTISYGQTVPLQLTAENPTAAFQFSGTNGQVVEVPSLWPGGPVVEPMGVRWRLVAPANYDLAAGDIVWGIKVTLPATGTYVLLAETTAFPQNYNFQLNLVSNPSGTVTGLPLAASGTVAASQTNTYTFSAPAGTWVFLDALTNNRSFIQLVAPSSKEVVYAWCVDAVLPVLPESGVYQVHLIGYETGNYAFRLLNLGTAPTAALATDYWGSTQPDRAEVYRFNGTPGQRLYFDTLGTNYNSSTFHLYHPSGVEIVLGGYYDWGFFIVSDPGSYTVALDGNVGAAGTYGLSLVEIGQSPTLPLTLDTHVMGTLTPGNRNSLHYFVATPNQKLFLDPRQGTNACGLVIYGPDSVAIGGCGFPQILSPPYFEFTPTRAGLYTVATYANSWDHPGPIPYSLRMVTPNVTTMALTLGKVVQGTIDEFGEEDRYSFAGTVGQRLFFDGLTAEAESFGYARLLRPDGTALPGMYSLASRDAGPVTLDQTGAYTLVLQGAGTVGAYAFRLLDVTESPAIPLAMDTWIERQLDPGTRTEVFHFHSAAGQRLYFNAMPTNSAQQWRLFDPDNRQLADQPADVDFMATLVTNGTYLLVIGGNSGTNPAACRFAVVTPETATSTLTLGSTTAATMTEPGKQDRYTFNGTAGQRLFYDAMSPGAEGVKVTLFRPNGGTLQLDGGLATIDSGPFTLPEPGTYTLVFNHTADTNSTYSFRLSDLASATAITYGVATSTQLNPPLEADLFRFAGVAGQKLNLTRLSASNPDATWSLFSPNNTRLASDSVASDLGEVVLPADGAYAVAVAGTADGPPLDFQFRIALVSSPTGTPSGFGVVHSGLATAGQTNAFTFTGRAGMVVYLDYLNNLGFVVAQLLAPDGTPVFGSAYSPNDAGPYFLPANGLYTLNVIGTTDGEFMLRLLDLTADTIPDLVLTNATQFTLDPVFAAQVYRFCGTNGQRLYYDSLAGTACRINLSFLTPSLVPWFITCAGSDAGPITLTEPGTNFLIFSGQTDSTQHAFRLLNGGPLPAETLALGSTVGAPLTPVPAAWLSVTGSYVGVSLRGYVPVDDWRATQTIAGTRGDTNIDFSFGQWGVLTNVGLVEGVNGGDGNWENFSVQWDGRVTNSIPNARLYLRSDAGSRLSIDFNHDDLFGDDPTEFVDNGWGSGEGSCAGPATTNLPAGTYTLRLQYEEGTEYEEMHLLRDGGVSLAPYQCRILRINGVAGQRLFFDSLYYHTPNADWTLYGPDDQRAAGSSLGGDFEYTPTQSGTHLLVLQSSSPYPVPYHFRVLVPTSTTNAIVCDTMVTNSIPLPGDWRFFSFQGTAGQRLLFDPVYLGPGLALPSWTPGLGFLELIDPYGGSSRIVLWGSMGWDSILFRLPQTGTYMLKIFGQGDATGEMVFRLMDVANAPVMPLATEMTGQIGLRYGTHLFRLPAIGGVPLYLDNMAATYAQKALYGPFDDFHESGDDIEYTPAASGTCVAVIASLQPEPLDYRFRVVAANQPPVLEDIAGQTVDEGSTLNLTVHAVDVDGDNDRLTYSLDPGAVVGASLNPLTGAFSWTPTEADGPGVYSFTVRVDDDGIPSFSDTNTFTVTVREVNLAPTLGFIADRVLNPGQRLSITNTYSDPDLPANPLTFTLISAPAGMTVSPAGVITWRPGAAQSGTSNLVQLRLDDHGTPNLNATRSFSVVVNPSAPVRLTPVVAGPDQFVFTLSGSAGLDYDVQVSTNLMPGSWTSLFQLSPTTMPVTLTNQFTPGTEPRQFYRAVVGP